MSAPNSTTSKSFGLPVAKPQGQRHGHSAHRRETDTSEAVDQPPAYRASATDRPLPQGKSATSLWQDAIEEVKPQLQKCLPDLQDDLSDRSQVVSSVCNATYDRQMESSASQKTLTLRNGKKKPLRDIYGHIVSFVKRFQAIGDIAIQADAGYASLPWVRHLVSFILLFLSLTAKC